MARRTTTSRQQGQRQVVKLRRNISVYGQFAVVPLTKGMSTIIDVEDIDLVYGFNWCALVTKTNTYAVRNSGTGKNQKTIFMHRVLTSCPVGLVVDHKNGDGLDNRRSENLRIANRSQNSFNSKIRNDNSSGHKGVWFRADIKKWTARIKAYGGYKNLGVFDRKASAILAYQKANSRLHGDFSNYG